MHVVGYLTAVLLVIILIPHLRSAAEIGGDEGFEFIKSLSLANGYVMYTEMWNDQPPLFAWLLSKIISVFGPSVLFLRLVTLSFAALLCVILWRLASRVSGSVAGLVAVFIFISSPETLKLSSSAMVELPSFCLGLISAYTVIVGCQQRSITLIIYGGCLIGIAAMVKLTALLFCPAIFLEIAISTSSLGQVWSGLRRQGFVKIIAFCASAILTTCLIFAAFPEMSIADLFRSHSSGRVREILNSPQYKFRLDIIFEHIDAFIACTVATIIFITKKRLNQITFPLVTLAVLLCVHLINRPWWSYYYIHFSVILSWIGGCALVESAKLAIQLGDIKTQKISLQWSCIFSVLAALHLTIGMPRLLENLRRIKRQPKIAESDVVTFLKSKRHEGDLIFTFDLVTAFHSGILLPPNLSIIPKKRVASGMLSDDKIASEVKSLQPRWLWLPRDSDKQSDVWVQVFRNYHVVYTGDLSVLLELNSASE